MNNKPIKTLPIHARQANGYLKERDRKLNKFYRPTFNYYGTPRPARAKCRTAVRALDYGQRAVERFKRRFGQVQVDQPEAVEATC